MMVRSHLIIDPQHPGEEQDCIVVHIALFWRESRGTVAHWANWLVEVPDHAAGRFLQYAPHADLHTALFAAASCFASADNDDETVIRVLADEAALPWTTGDPGHISIINPTGDPLLDAKVAQAARESDKQFGIQASIRAGSELTETIASAREILNSEQLKSLMNVRDKHIAHSLTETRRERHGPIAPIKIGDEINLVERSIPIVERLYCWVNGTSFSITESQRIDQDNAEALWHGCNFKVLR